MKTNKYCNLTNGTTIVELTQGQWTILNTDDWEKIKCYKWYVIWEEKMKSFYATTTIKKKVVYLHRIIMDSYDTKIHIDHKSHDTLDNRRENLRKTTHQRNHFNTKLPITNTSGYKGVWWNKLRNKWGSQIKINRKKIHLGLFLDPKDAARAYDKKALELFGEFAFTNKMMGLL